MRELGGTGHNSSKTILNTLKPLSSITCEIPSESFKIPDMNKTSLTGIPDMASESNRTPRFLTGDSPGERRLSILTE